MLLLLQRVLTLLYSDIQHKKLKKLKNVNKRLHLNLTELPSVKNNNPIISNLSFIKLLFIDELKKQKILNEIDNQIKKFKKVYKPKELKVDGHEHIHMIPWILEYLLKKRKYYKIKELRNSNELLMIPRIKDLFNTKYIRNFLACSCTYCEEIGTFLALFFQQHAISTHFDKRSQEGGRLPKDKQRTLFYFDNIAII